MTSGTTPDPSVQVYRTYIKATPSAVWDAITESAVNRQYGYQAAGEYELRPGGSFRVWATEEMRTRGAPELIIEGEVLEADPPGKLVQTWRALFSPETAAEGATRLIWEIDEYSPGVTRLTVVHELGAAPQTAALVGGADSETGGGWSLVLSDLKSLLETGEPLQPGGA